MPFLPQDKRLTKSTSRPSSSLLRVFNDLYKRSATPIVSSTVRAPALLATAKSSRGSTPLYSLEPAVHLPLYSLRNRSSRHGFPSDFESNSFHSDASSSRQTLELAPEAVDVAPPPISAPPQRSHIKPLRPALKRSTHCTSSARRLSTHNLHVSFVIPTEPDPTEFAMHPLFDYTHLNHARISCDMMYLPCTRTILDRHTRTPIENAALDEPATEPAVHTQLVLKCELFPWEIVVSPNVSASPLKPAHSSSTRRSPITNRDVLLAVHEALAEQVTAEEWARLGSHSRAQRRISRAYERRCVQLGAGWEDGVRRIDWLDGCTRLVGIGLKDSALNPPRLIFKTVA